MSLTSKRPQIETIREQGIVVLVKAAPGYTTSNAFDAASKDHPRRIIILDDIQRLPAHHRDTCETFFRATSGGTIPDTEAVHKFLSAVPAYYMPADCLRNTKQKSSL